MTFLDTNVLVYSIDGNDPAKQVVAREIVVSAVRGGDEILTEDLNDGQMYGSVKAVNPFKGL